MFKSFFALLMLPTLALSGCQTQSVLIHKDDAAFNEGLKLFEATAVRLEKETASMPEKMLFIQAESHYRYRFEPPVRSNTSYFAEAAAALTDFPAFQALAGSLDLGNLRLRSADSAVQLWETLLERYPQSGLRPLTLYRLGWAYRNVGITGLPHNSPDEVFEVLINDNPGSALARLAEDARHVPWKSKDAAASRSIIPGWGQLYVGERRNGVIRVGIAAASVAAIVIPIMAANQKKSELSWKNDWKLLASGLGGLVVLSWDFTSSFEDAMRGVIDFNERQERDFNRKHPEAP